MALKYHRDLSQMADTVSAGIGQFAAIQTAAPVGIELSVMINALDTGEREHAIADFARTANAGLIVTPNRWTINRPDVITALAARQKVPAVFGSFARAGGLISYGSDQRE